MVLLMLILPLQPAPPVGPIDVSRVALSPPALVLEIDTGRLNGEPEHLSVSADGTEIYFQAIRRDRWGNGKVVHYVIAVGPKVLRREAAQPAWSEAYWVRKAGMVSPDSALKIESETTREIKTATASPRGGEYAGMGLPSSPGSGISREEMLANQAQNVVTTTLRVKGDVVGVWVNKNVQLGSTFSWAPAGGRAIAYVRPDGRLALADASGHKQTIAATTAASYPAWSDDGKRIVYLQKTSKKKYVVKVIEVSVR